MPEESIRDLVVCITAGVALLLLAGSSLLVRRWPATARAAAGSAIALGAALAPLAFGIPSAAAWPALVVVGLAAGVAALGSARVADWVGAALSSLRRPAVRATVLAVCGLGLAAGAFARYDSEEQAAIDRDMEQMLSVTYKPPTRESADHAATDGGRRVALHETLERREQKAVSAAERQLLDNLKMSDRLIRAAPASDACNCHGWVFTGGRYWLSPEDVENILADNGYQSVSDPRPGDLAIYRTGNMIAHTAVVRAAGGGTPVLVEGKWGWMGVFLHPVGGSCYGTDCTFYRSPRDGHLLTAFAGGSAGPGGMAGH
jgi:hypothetical protein